ncbi:MAG: preprotein translocase subunit SecE [Actinobacteria bacterium]|nr:preprotein translocase subunit SecE [Actinomycetota bacterium]
MLNRQLRRVQDKSKTPAQKQRSVAQRKKVAERKKAEKKGIWERIVQFLKDVRIELKKVIWPSKSEVVNYTIVVLVTVTVVTTFILVLDLILSKLLQLIT